MYLHQYFFELTKYIPMLTETVCPCFQESLEVVLQNMIPDNIIEGKKTT